MEMYSSFETNLTLQTRNNLRDVSFSSYLNKEEENMIRKLTSQASYIPNDHHYRKKSNENEEIDVFGAEKYFKGEIEEGDNKIDPRFINTNDTIINVNQHEGQIEEFEHSFLGKQRIDQVNMHTPSARSNISWNSRSGLLPHTKQAPRKIEKGSKTRIFLSRFGCNCINKKSTQISEKRFIQAKDISKTKPKMFDLDAKTVPLSSNYVEKNTRNDYFSFPVLNSSDLNSISTSDCSNSKSGNLAGKLHEDNNKNNGELSLGRKLSLLNNWDVDIPTEDEMYIPSSGMYNDDIDSDSSSDLFEIESFSTTGNSSFLAHRNSESNCYAPSEVSVDWSVVTASAADFSAVSDYEDGGWRNSGGKVSVTENKCEEKKRPGILSGCVSHKAVRVSGDECKISGGGAGGRRRRLSESMAVGSLFRGVTRGNYGSDVSPLSEGKERHATQLLYIQ